MPDQNNPTTASDIDWNREDAYWREQHQNQPYADKRGSYEDYAAAYRVGVEGAGKYGGEITMKLRRVSRPITTTRPQVRHCRGIRSGRRPARLGTDCRA